MRRPVVLAIAGHDPSGGAGIMADQRVIEAAGGAAVTCVTALTVQSTVGVSGVHPVDGRLLAEQIDRIVLDCAPGSVKIGKLGGAEQVGIVAECIQRHGLANVVLDPVLASTGGTPLLNARGIELLIGELLPLCALATPNLFEAARLSGLDVETIEEMASAGRALQALGAEAVLVKGGHLQGDPVDVLVAPGNVSTHYRGARVDTRHTHGTGCFLSSAIAARLALGRTLEDAVREAKEALTQALANPLVIGKGRGCPWPARED